MLKLKSPNGICAKLRLACRRAVEAYAEDANNNVNNNLDGTVQDTDQDEVQEDRRQKLILFCEVPRTREEMMRHIGLSHKGHFRAAYLLPLLTTGKLRMTIPDKPNSKNQRYVKI